jgi:copper chaperone NosL
MKRNWSITVRLKVVGVLFLFFACSKKPDPIVYGKDQCHFCKMTIVDQAHAAQYVSDKGKQFKYDAIECLIRDVVRNKIDNRAHTLVADYSQPGQMIDALKAHYIISEQIKSPMGANLSAVGTREEALKILEEATGEWFDWTSVQGKMEKGH